MLQDFIEENFALLDYSEGEFAMLECFAKWFMTYSKFTLKKSLHHWIMPRKSS